MKDANQILKNILSERQAANGSYSLRAFARDLGISAPQLSNVMNGNRGLSPATTEKVMARLSLDPLEKEIFKSSLKANFALSKKERISSKAKLAELNQNSTAKFLDLDLFKAISNWHHFALLELIKISPHSERTPAKFSEKLDVSENEVQLALGRLERLELIQKTKTSYQVNQDTVIADQGIPTEAIRNFHRQLLEKSIQALAFQSKDQRYGYSAAMPVKVKNVARAKKLIQKFRLDFAKEISTQEGGEEIYGLCFQFFQLTKVKDNGDEIL